VFLQHWPAVTKSHPTGASTHLLEIFSPDVNKLTMLQHVCAMHHIDTMRVVAIGDGLNDVELVGGVGLGIAMGNASPPVREVARRVTAGHDADGVAVAIRHVLEGRW
jgi:hydroxymethylpyrimidine pyrophosphatase-like HAD family hydrolase